MSDTSKLTPSPPKADLGNTIVTSEALACETEHYIAATLHPQHALVSGSYGHIPLMLPHSGTRGLSDKGLAKLINQADKLETEAAELARRAGEYSKLIRELRELRKDEREAKDAVGGGG